MKRFLIILAILLFAVPACGSGPCMDLTLGGKCGGVDDAVAYLPLTGSLNDAAGGVASATFARSTATTRVNPTTGYIETVPADTPAFEKRGLQFIGTSVTNYVTDSEDFTTWGSILDVTLVPGYSGPDNNNSAFKATDGASGTVAYFGISVGTLSSSSPHTCCVYAKQGTSDDFSISLYDLSDSSFAARAHFEWDANGNLITDSIDYGLDFGTEEIGHGWWLAWVVSSDGLSTVDTYYVYLYPTKRGRQPSSPEYTYFFGAGCYDTRFAPPYIKTTGSTASRAADSLYWTMSASVSDLFDGNAGTNDTDGASEGTVLCTWTPMMNQAAGPANDYSKGVLSTKTSPTSLVYHHHDGGALYRYVAYDDTNSPSLINQTADRSTNIRRLVIFSKSLNILQVGVKKNGSWSWSSTTAYDGAFYISDTPAKLYIGINNPYGFWIKNIRIYNSALSTSYIEGKF